MPSLPPYQSVVIVTYPESPDEEIATKRCLSRLPYRDPALLAPLESAIREGRCRVIDLVDREYLSALDFLLSDAEQEKDFKARLWRINDAIRQFKRKIRQLRNEEDPDEHY